MGKCQIKKQGVLGPTTIFRRSWWKHSCYG